MRSKAHQAKKKQRKEVREETRETTTQSDDTDIVSSHEESPCSDDDTTVIPRLQRSTAVRYTTTTQSETHLITSNDSLVEKVCPSKNSAVIFVAGDPDSQLSCATGESRMVEDYATTEENKKKFFLGL